MNLSQKNHIEQTQIDDTISLYISCEELYLDRFMQIIVNGKIELLIITGKPSIELLQETWDNIYAEYIELISGNENSEIHKAIKDINLWQWRFERIELMLKILSENYVEGLIVQFKKMGYNYAFNIEDRKSYMEDLDAVYSHSKILIVQIQNRKKDLESLQSQQSKISQKPTEAFDHTLIELSQHNGYQVIPSKITVAMFARMVSRLNEYNKNLSKSLEKQREKAKWHKN